MRYAAFAVSLLSVMCSPLAAQIKPSQCAPFFSNTIYFQDQGISSQAGDFNNDGIPDLAVLTSLSLNILLGKGNGQFQPPLVVATGGGWDGIVVGDFNHDRKLDVAVARTETSTSGTVNVYLGNGDGSFQAPFSSALYSYSFFLAVGDFNRDGNLDLAAISHEEGAPYAVQVLLGKGDGTFQPPVDYSLGEPPTANPAAIAVADFNGDGHLDLAVTNMGILAAPGNTVTVLLGNGDGTFQIRKEFLTGYGPQGIAAADFNGDGNMDLATANGVDGTVSVLLGRGDGTFRPAATYQAGHPLEAPATLAAAQFDRNEMPGLVVGTITGTFILRNNGDGTFQAAQGYDPAAFQVLAADFNGDGIADLALTAAASNEGVYVSSLTVLLGIGHGEFPTSRAYSVLGAPRVAAVGDFNGDGIPDLVAASQETGYLGILLGTGNGRFSNWENETVYSLAQPTAIAVGDVNGDGKLDLVIIDSDGGKLQVLFGNGDGTFTPGTKFSAGSPIPASIALADFNGDGVLDLAVTNAGTDPNPAKVTVLFGKADGTFQSPASYVAGLYYYIGLAVADFNGDGKLDLAVAEVHYLGGHLTIPTLNVFLNHGDGTFQNPVQTPLMAEGYSIAVADFNGDGIPDAAVFLSTSEIQVMLGNGNGTFRLGSTVKPPLGPFGGSVVAADFDGDGNADLAFSSTDTSFLQMFPGKGDGTFRQTINTLTGMTPFAPVVADLNGDGTPDLVLPNLDSGTFSVFLNRCPVQ